MDQEVLKTEILELPQKRIGMSLKKPMKE